jgi:transposase
VHSLARYREVVGAAIVERSDRRTDNKLKLVKRMMYGRAKIDLLEARLICAN